jgi:RNA polymerase sigma-70 factor, ECF subfamily
MKECGGCGTPTIGVKLSPQLLWQILDIDRPDRQASHKARRAPTPYLSGFCKDGIQWVYSHFISSSQSTWWSRRWDTCGFMKDESVSLSGDTSQTLLHLARIGDESAWRRVAGIYEPLIRRWARCYGVSDTDATDVCQEVLLAAAMNLSGFDRQRTGSFRRWLKNITRNKIISARRKAFLPIPDALSDDLPEPPETPATISEEKRILFERIVESVRSRFEESTWLMFRMTYLEGRPIADVAAELGKNRGAVDIARSRVLAFIREQFAEHIEEE